MLQDRKPLYVVLAEKISVAIQNGLYPIGTFLPNEGQLGSQYQVSRATVREAVRILQELGMVTRKQGSGTLVQSANALGKYVLEMDAIPDLWQYVEHSDLQVGAVRLISRADALTPLPAATEKWYQIEATRSVNSEQPLAWKHVYIDAQYAAVVNEIGNEKIPIYSFIERHYGIKVQRIQQSIGSSTMPDRAAKALGCKPGSIGLEILRSYYDDAQRLCEVTLTIYPSNRFKYNNELKLQYGPAKRM
jgi:GntR family transcriptional regulator